MQDALIKSKHIKGMPRYSTAHGACFFPMSSGEIIQLSFSDCLDVFATLADALGVNYDVDGGMYWQMHDKIKPLIAVEAIEI